MTSLNRTPILANLMLPEELSSRIGVQVQTLARWRCERRGPTYFKIGGRRVVYPVDDVDRWLETCKRTISDDEWE